MANASEYFADVKKFEAEIETIVKERDKQGLEEYVFKELGKWKDININIAVTGQTGAGKSAFINAIRGLQPSDQQAAAEDVTECTQEPTPYSHPRNTRFVLWDLPGIGTTAWKRSSYVKTMQFQVYDFFIYISSQRFTEIDSDLVQTLRDLGKPFFFVRARIDADVANDKHCKGKDCDEKDTLKRIREDCERHLPKFTKNRVYLIDNHSTSMYDFEELQRDLLAAAPEEKREALILTVTEKSKTVIKGKSKTLHRISILTACKATMAVAVPGADIFMDGNILLEEVQFYQKQFGLDETSMRKSSEILDMTTDTMRQMLNLRNETFTVESIISFCKSFIQVCTPHTTTTQSTAFPDPSVPLIYAFHSMKSLRAAYCGLNEIRLSMEKDAVEISEAIAERVRGSSIL